MHLQRFVEWCETATSRQRADGFAILARECLDPRSPDVEARHLGSALLLALDDPSPKVRLALAQTLGPSRAAPRPLVRALLLDDEAIALAVVRSPVLGDDDLLDALMVARAPVQSAIAARHGLAPRLAAAIAARSCAGACEALLANDDVEIGADILRIVGRRHGADARLRAALLGRPDLPPDVRQALILETGRTLQSSSFVAGVLGEDAAQRLVFDSCERATSKMAERVKTRDVPALVEHLRATGQISGAFLLRSACAGNVDLLAATLTALSGLTERRVRAIVVEGRDAPFQSVARRCGLSSGLARLIRIAVRQWREIATKGLGPDSGDVAERVMRRVVESYRAEAQGTANEPIVALLRRLEAETRHDALHSRSRRLLAA